MDRPLDDGSGHYRLLGLPRSASASQITQAYRRLARARHPDKPGGSAAAFAALQAAYEVLAHPSRRAAYDALGGDVRYRPGAAAAAAAARQGGGEAAESAAGLPPGAAEAALLAALLARCPAGSADPATQLCITCELCLRPATKECWTCGMHICEFCTRRQHWKAAVSLHWPLVNAPNRLTEQLGRQELELKRREDGAAFKARQPGFRPEPELHVLRQFQDDVTALLAAAGPPTALAAAVQKAAGRGSSATVVSCSSNSSSRFAITAAASSLVMAGQPAALPAPAAAPAAPLALAHTGGCAGALVRGSQQQLATRSSGPGKQQPCLRAWLAADAAAISRLQCTYEDRLARFYLWTQTPSSLLLAVYMPTGGSKAPPQLEDELTPVSLHLQHRGFAPVLCRRFAHAVDAASHSTSWVSGDGQLVALVVPKAVPGKAWASCFKGDSFGARCLQPPYKLLQQAGEVQLELPLPFWVVPEEDVDVVVGEHELTVTVDGLLSLRRRYWRDEAQAARLGSAYHVVDTAASSWCVLGEQQPAWSSSAGEERAAAAARRPGKQLSISLALPALTLEEVQFKKGVRQNNAAATRACRHGAGKTGVAFFADDEDEFGLAPLLQALLFAQTGRSWVGPQPWEAAAGTDSGGTWVDDARALPAGAREHLKWLTAGTRGRGFDGVDG